MLDTKLAITIAQVESSGNRWAIRYEPEFRWIDKATVQICAEANKCNETTAYEICKTSYGFYQIMGENLYSQGLKFSIGQYFNDLSLQYNALFRFLDRGNWADTPLSELLADDNRLMDFARYYNGPGNPQAYADAMRNAARRLGYVAGTEESKQASRTV